MTEIMTDIETPPQPSFIFQDTKAQSKDYEEYERTTFKRIQQSLECLHCDTKGSISSRGGNGNLDARGVRKISLLCTSCKGPTFRLEAALDKIGDKETLESLATAHSKVPIEPTATKRGPKGDLKQPALSFAAVTAKRRRDPKLILERPTEQHTEEEEVTNLGNFWKDMAIKAEERADRAEKRAERAENQAAELLREMRALRVLIEGQNANPVSNPSHPTPTNVRMVGDRPQVVPAKNRKSASEDSGSGVGGRFVPGLDIPRDVVETGASDEGAQPWTAVTRKNSSSATTQPQRKGDRENHSCRKAATKLLQPKRDPMEFSVVRIKINDTRPLRNVKGKERAKILRETSKVLGVEKSTALISTIGNSIIEFYIPGKDEATVRERLVSKKVEIIEGVLASHQPTHAQQSPEACKESTVKRLTHLCLVARTKNLQETILEGSDQATRSAVLERYRMVLKNPDAPLGRPRVPVESIMQTDESDL